MSIHIHLCTRALAQRLNRVRVRAFSKLLNSSHSLVSGHSGHSPCYVSNRSLHKFVCVHVVFFSVLARFVGQLAGGDFVGNLAVPLLTGNYRTFFLLLLGCGFCVCLCSVRVINDPPVHRSIKYANICTRLHSCLSIRDIRACIVCCQKFTNK